MWSTGRPCVAVTAPQFNTLVEKKLAKEKKKIADKQRELTKLNNKLKLAQKNQAKIFCGVALWKVRPAWSRRVVGRCVLHRSLGRGSCSSCAHVFRCYLWSPCCS